MDKTLISKAIGECHDLINMARLNQTAQTRDRQLYAAEFGLEIIDIMLSEPVEMPKIHVIKIDTTEAKDAAQPEKPDPSEGESKPYSCHRCHNEEFSPGAKF